MYKWDERFMVMAQLVSSWSKDPDNKVGAVLTSQTNRVLSVGFNGLPRGIEEYTTISKLAKTVHAEVNCIVQSHASPIGQHLYVTRFPCAQCAALIAQVRIIKLVCPPVEVNSSWTESMLLAREILTEAGITIIHP